jgi:hypothetical protein
VLGVRVSPPLPDIKKKNLSVSWGFFVSKSEEITPPCSNLKPQTSNLKPQTSNLKPQTSNLKPQTSNLKPQTSNQASHFRQKELKSMGNVP